MDFRKTFDRRIVCILTVIVLLASGVGPVVAHREISEGRDFQLRFTFRGIRLDDFRDAGVAEILLEYDVRHPGHQGTHQSRRIDVRNTTPAGSIFASTAPQKGDSLRDPADTGREFPNDLYVHQDCEPLTDVAITIRVWELDYTESDVRTAGAASTAGWTTAAIGSLALGLIVIPEPATSALGVSIAAGVTAGGAAAGTAGGMTSVYGEKDYLGRAVHTFPAPDYQQDDRPFPRLQTIGGEGDARITIEPVREEFTGDEWDCIRPTAGDKSPKTSEDQKGEHRNPDVPKRAKNLTMALNFADFEFERLRDAVEGARSIQPEEGANLTEHQVANLPENHTRTVLQDRFEARLWSFFSVVTEATGDVEPANLFGDAARATEAGEFKKALDLYEQAYDDGLRRLYAKAEAVRGDASGEGPKETDDDAPLTVPSVSWVVVAAGLVATGVAGRWHRRDGWR